MAGYAIFIGTLAVMSGVVYLLRNLIFGYPAAPSPREPITDYRSEVARYGEALGVPVGDERIDRLLEKVARDSQDVFGSTEAAMRFLSEGSMDGGLTAREVLQLHGLSPVLRRIDNIRFGVFA